MATHCIITQGLSSQTSSLSKSKYHEQLSHDRIIWFFHIADVPALGQSCPPSWKEVVKKLNWKQIYQTKHRSVVQYNTPHIYDKMQIRVLLLTMPRSPWNRGKPAIEHLGFSGLAQNLNSISLPHSTFPHSSDQHQHFIKIPNVPCNVHLVQYFHHGNTHGSWSNPSNRKKYPSFCWCQIFANCKRIPKM